MKRLRLTLLIVLVILSSLAPAASQTVTARCKVETGNFIHVHKHSQLKRIPKFYPFCNVTTKNEIICFVINV